VAVSLGCTMSEEGIKIISTPDGAVRTEVQLGRDAATRPWRLIGAGEGAQKQFECQACGQFTLDSVDQCDICPQCSWEDWYECHDLPDKEVRPNYSSLNRAREIVRRFGPAAFVAANEKDGPTIEEFEAMSREELAALPTLEDIVKGKKRAWTRSFK
jgi:hypothetical protein